jgi:hypothetical protein
VLFAQGLNLKWQGKAFYGVNDSLYPSIPSNMDDTRLSNGVNRFAINASDNLHSKTMSIPTSSSSSSAAAAADSLDKTQNGYLSPQSKQSPTKPVIQHRHLFLYSLEPSLIDKSSLSLTLDYRPFSKFSLWTTMRDELRLLPLPQSDYDIMIGMGSMGWSGGHLNSSPFVLWKYKSP